MADYIVTTPKNPEYCGKTYGVLFRNGRAFVSEHTIDPDLGLEVDEVVRRMQADFGYKVKKVKGMDTIEAAPPKKTSQKRKEAGAKAPEVIDGEEET